MPINIKHTKGGNFKIKVTPDAMDLLNRYIEKLNCQGITCVEDLFVAQFGQQMEFVFAAMQEGEHDPILELANLQVPKELMS